jgi:deazaflavin-dependent oxidoreductase (nitroreductase family)
MVSLLRVGIPMGPTILLTVRGRRTGQPRTTPVGVFERNGQRWLFAQLGGDLHWVRNLRAAGEGILSRGRRQQAIVAVELAPEAAAAVLKDVVAPWIRGPMGAMATVMAGGRILDVALDAPVNEFINEVRRHPVFEVIPGPVPGR